jgi:hypothetical protein
MYQLSQLHDALGVIRSAMQERAAGDCGEGAAT